jgi:hypothetical protein
MGSHHQLRLIALSYFPLAIAKSRDSSNSQLYFLILLFLWEATTNKLSLIALSYFPLAIAKSRYSSNSQLYFLSYYYFYGKPPIKFDLSLKSIKFSSKKKKKKKFLRGSSIG